MKITAPTTTAPNPTSDTAAAAISSASAIRGLYWRETALASDSIAVLNISAAKTAVMQTTTKHHSMAEILEDHRRRDRDRGREQVEEEIALAANASLQSTKRGAKFCPEAALAGMLVMLGGDRFHVERAIHHRSA